MTVIGFFARKTFLLVLDAEYLGLSGLFSSVLTMLSLAELGIGPAMIFSLYKPLADHDIPVCKALMRLYKKAYLIIGSVILGIGLIVSPFITGLLKNIPEQINHIHFIFILFVVDTAISYFFSYKRSLIIASQSHYKIDSVHTVTYLLRNGCQIVILFLTENYIFYLFIQILSTACENLWLSKWVDRKYDWLADGKDAEALSKEIYLPIIRNVRAMIFHRIGGVVFDAIDNVLISRFFGVLFLGLYSNYLLVIDAVKKCVSSVFSAVSASIGDFGATEGAESSYTLYKRISFLNFWIALFCSTCIYVLLPPFIELFFGEEYKISHNIFIVIAINFYIECMRKTVLTFKESYGLPWYDRYKPIVGAIVNIITSVTLALRWGVIGVFIGTTITQLCVNVWVEAEVVFKHAFNKNVICFLKDYVLYAAIGFIISFFSQFICANVCFFSNFGNFALKCLICIWLSNTAILIIFHRTEEFQYMRKIVMKYLFRNQT